MPTLNYRIGLLTNASTGTMDATKIYDFQDLQGTPMPATQRVEDFERQGVNYHGLRKTSKIGPRFSMRSIEYIEFDTNNTTTLASAATRLADYHALIGSAIGVRMDQRSMPYYPLDVIDVQFERPPQLIGAAAGSLVDNPAVLLRCVWVLRMRQA